MGCVRKLCVEGEDMSRDKQIEEMARVIARRSKDFRNPNVAFMTTANKTAESLYNTGYRKAYDVAREICEEIEKCTIRKVVRNGEVLYDFSERFAELKKKYTVVGNENEY